jgi:hypothetical protein
LFVPYFFRELLGFLLNWRKQRPKGLKPFARYSAKAFESLTRKKVNVTSQKGLFATKTRPYCIVTKMDGRMVLKNVAKPGGS